MEASLDAELLVDCGNALGECVLWDTETDRLLWTDVDGLALHSCDEHGADHWRRDLPEKLGSFALDPAGNLLAAFASGLFRYELETGRRDRLTEFEPHLPATRLNDGRCDRQGRFVVGGCHQGFYNAVSSLISYEAERGARELFGDVALTNGLCFSLDGRRMYFSDSESLLYHVFDYDPATGDVGEGRVLAQLRRGEGFVDGACVDADDSVWSARYYGGFVQQYLRDGEEGLRVRVPARCVSCVCFGGRHLDTLFITTAHKDLTAKQRQAEPCAGGLFRARVGRVGVPESRFAHRLF